MNDIRIRVCVFWGKGMGDLRFEEDCTFGMEK